jgi:hypothetical protein
MSSNACRLRKYLRKKRRARDPKKFDRLARLYWRYHFKVYGGHIQLWSAGD